MTTWLPSIPLPSDWPAHAQLALLHAIALAHFGLTHVRGLGVPPRAPPRLPLHEVATTVAAWPAAAPSPPGAVLARAARALRHIWKHMSSLRPALRAGGGDRRCAEMATSFRGNSSVPLCA
jgi:hypothetical protein